MQIKCKYKRRTQVYLKDTRICCVKFSFSQKSAVNDLRSEMWLQVLRMKSTWGNSPRSNINQLSVLLLFRCLATICHPCSPWYASLMKDSQSQVYVLSKVFISPFFRHHLELTTKLPQKQLFYFWCYIRPADNPELSWVFPQAVPHLTQGNALIACFHPSRSPFSQSQTSYPPPPATAASLHSGKQPSKSRTQSWLIIHGGKCPQAGVHAQWLWT